MTRMTLVRTAAAVLTVSAVLAGCGGGDEPPSPASAPSAADEARQHNDADVTFAQLMIPHHAQAVEMAKLAQDHTTTPAVLDLAERVRKAQDPEIQAMSAWLMRWGARAPATTGMDHMGHGPEMPGMMSEEEMARLAQVRNADFDHLWLTMMITHHEGAIEMARTELSGGGSAEAKRLAQQIIDAQQAEIAEMRALLDKH